MKPHERTFANRIGKSLAIPLSRLAVSSMTEGVVRLVEAYLCILQGKGAGSGWSLETEIKAALTQINNSTPVVFDVGANVGKWSLLLRKHFPDARIFLFEPQQACQKAISNLNIPNSVLIPKVASSATGQIVQLFSDADTSEKAAVHQRRDSYFSSSTFTPTDVETVTIDDVVRLHEIARVDFMKIDVEGHELDVLLGAKESLASRRIKAFSFEFGSGNINSRTFFHDFWDLIVPLGYKIYRILPSSRLMPIREYYEDCEYFRGVTNYIGVLSEPE